MSKSIRNLLSLLVLLQLIIPCSILADVGEFTSVVGNVTQTRVTEVIRPIAKSTIELEDLIATDRASSTAMVFSDDSTIMMAENTKLEIKEFLFKEKSRTGIFSLMIGKVTATVKKFIGGDNVFEVHSPTAVVGVRGTGFEFTEAVKQGPTGSTVESRMATVACTDGSLMVSGLSDTGVIISTMVIEAGQMAVIVGGVITISKIGAMVVAAVGRAAESGAASAAGGGTGTGTGGSAAAGGGATTTTAGGASGGTTATTGAATASTGLSTPTTVGLAIGGVAIVGGAAAAAGGGGGGSSSSGGGGSECGTSQTTFEIAINNPQLYPASCTNLNNVCAGKTIVFSQGVGRWPTPDEARTQLAGHYAVISLDGSPLNVYYKGITLQQGLGQPDGYGDGASANWVVTSGTHTVTAFWTKYPQGSMTSCTFTISK